MKHWPENIIEKAKILRRQGFSYGFLTKELNVPRSTLHSWMKVAGIARQWTRGDNKLHLKEIRGLAAVANRAKRNKRIMIIAERLKKEISESDFNNKFLLKTVLSILYLAEGSKTRGQVMFANTDPKLSLFFITLLRKCYEIDESKLRIRLHLHYYHNIKKTKQYWANLLKVSEEKFGKIYIKKRSKTKRFRKNFAGICFIRYYSEALREELIQRAYLTAGIVNNKYP